MDELKLIIKINTLPKEIFDFCLNPENTPKWIDSIIKEETNEWPPKLGTIYRNTSDGKKWNEYFVTEFEENKIFTLTSKDGNYHVRYTITPIDANSCDLKYFEWVDNGELEEPFNIETLQRLKELIELK